MKWSAVIGLLLLLLIGCESSENVEQRDSAELTFRVSTSATISRGNVSDYPNVPSQWTQAERIVDGRYMYVLSVYILNSNKQIVAAQEGIIPQAEATEVAVTFDKSYNLKRGVYTVMAVANYTDHTIGSTTYASGLIGDWQSDDYEALMNNKISGNSTHNVSPKNVIQPLSLMKEIELHAGNNEIEGEFIRTFARVRIEVKNNSGILPLNISSLSFSDNFTQQQAYVFDDGTDRKYFGNTEAPTATSEHALQPFTYNGAGEAMAIEAQTSAVVFDGYLLESQLNEEDFYKYTLALNYTGAVPSYSYNPNWTTAINQINRLEVGEESYFLLYNSNRRRYLSAGTDRVTTATLSTSSSTVATDHVWQLVSAGTNSYYLLNVETNLYMQNPTNSAITLGSTPVAFTFATRNRYITIAGSNGSYAYVGSSNTNYAVTGYASNNNNGAYFTLYKVNKNQVSQEGSSISYNTPIILTTIDPITQQSSPTRAIKRNDFINVLVTVSYNAVAGTFEFYVEDWKEGGGSVEFN